jgi:hypothetical protein
VRMLAHAAAGLEMHHAIVAWVAQSSTLNLPALGTQRREEAHAVGCNSARHDHISTPSILEARARPWRAVVKRVVCGERGDGEMNDELTSRGVVFLLFPVCGCCS